MGKKPKVVLCSGLAMQHKLMTNRQIAKCAGEFCFGIAPSRNAHAMQLLVEKLVLPPDVDDYTAEGMAERIEFVLGE